MAQTGSVGNINARDAYSTSFGALADKTHYAGYDAEVKSNNDIRAELNDKLQIGIKSFNTQTGGAGTAGYAMIPVFVDPQIVDRTRKQTPLCEIFPRVTNQGMQADFNVITAKGGAFMAGEDAALSETTTTYDRASTDIKFMYSVGRVTGQAQAATPSYMLQGFQPNGGAVGGFGDSAAPNAMQNEVLVKARELKELEEDKLINGSVSTDANDFEGFIGLQSTTNKVDKNTTALTLEDVNTAVQYAFDDGGLPNLAVCSSAVFTDLQNLLVGKIGYLQSTEQVFWGFSTIVLNTSVGRIPVIQSRFMSNVSGSKAIYFLDLSVWEVRVLQDMTYEELAKTNDSRKFMLKQYQCLICRATGFNAFIGEIA
jgi:hypothetical protein